MARKAPTDPRLLTDGELELMDCLWNLEEGSVRDVLDALPTGRQPAYTSVSTILRILEKKGIVESRKVGRGHLYRPLLSRGDFEGVALNRVVQQVFKSQPKALIARLIEGESLSQDQLEEIRNLVERRLK